MSDLSINGLLHCIGDEDHPITTAPTYGGISRGEFPTSKSEITMKMLQDAFAGVRHLEPNLLERVTTGERRALEPTSIDRITPAQKFGADMPSARPEEWDEPLRPSPLMRRLGYTTHPATCTHYRKRLMLGSDTWRCADCGVGL